MHASICMHFSAAWVQSTKLAQENRSPNDAYVLAYDYDFIYYKDTDFASLGGIDSY